MAKREAPAEWECHRYGHTYNFVEPIQCIWCEHPKPTEKESHERPA